MRVKRLQLAGAELTGLRGEYNLQGGADERQGGALACFRRPGKQRGGQFFQLLVVGSSEGCERVPRGIRGVRAERGRHLAQDVAPDGRVTSELALSGGIPWLRA